VTKDDGSYDPDDAKPTAASAGTDAGTRKLPDPDAPVAKAAAEEREADKDANDGSKSADAPKGGASK
jgi:hypothetical protein